MPYGPNVIVGWMIVSVGVGIVIPSVDVVVEMVKNVDGMGTRVGDSVIDGETPVVDELDDVELVVVVDVVVGDSLVVVVDAGGRVVEVPPPDDAVDVVDSALGVSGTLLAWVDEVDEPESLTASSKVVVDRRSMDPRVSRSLESAVLDGPASLDADPAPPAPGWTST